MNIGLNIGYSHTKGVGKVSGAIRTVHFPSVVGSPDVAHWSPGGDILHRSPSPVAWD